MRSMKIRDPTACLSNFGRLRGLEAAGNQIRRYAASGRSGPRSTEACRDRPASAASAASGAIEANSAGHDRAGGHQ